MTTLLVLAKQPVAGRVKTRLTPAFAPDEAAQLAEAALADTLAAVSSVPAERRILVLDGEPDSWVPAGMDVLSQARGGLDERIAASFEAVKGPAVLVGMDTPQLSPALLDLDWACHDAWLGPAADGGFWALGMREPDPRLMRGVPMSRSWTGAVLWRRLVASGRRVATLPVLRDVDTLADAQAVAALAPNGRFAARFVELTGRTKRTSRPRTSSSALL